MNPSSNRVAVVTRSSDAVTALGVADILRSDSRLAVLDGADQVRAEVVVVVETTADDGVFAFLREVRARTVLPSPPRCVLVTDHFPIDALMTAIECGMAALLRRCDTSDEELLWTVHSVSTGAAHLPPRLQGGLLTHLDRLRRDVLEPHGLTMSGLSARERDILRLLAEGASTEEVAGVLSSSQGTVKYVLSGLMSRYNLTSRAHAVAFALRAGVI